MAISQLSKVRIRGDDVRFTTHQGTPYAVAVKEHSTATIFNVETLTEVRSRLLSIYLSVLCALR